MMITKARTGLVVGVLALGMAGFTAGCSSSKAESCKDFNNSIQKSVDQMTASESDPNAFITSARNVVTQLQAKAASATDSKVKSAVSNFATDLDSLINDMQKAESGDTSVTTELTTLVTKIQTDGQTLDAVCK
jgi:hypothetical protein